MGQRSEGGDIVHGRFKLERRIGTRGFATVWQGKDRDTGEEVAVKLPDDSSHDNSKVRVRFQRELRVLKRYSSEISHQSIIHLVDGRVDNKAMYLALEYVEGSKLDDVAETNLGGFGTSLATKLGIPITSALAFLHRNNVIYLDLKPSNILVETSSNPVLIDFNTAVKRSEGASTLFYEDAYKPPELTPSDMRDREAGSWSDVYACGKLRFYLLTGKELQTQETPTDGIDPREHMADCSDELAAVIHQATGADPNRRYTDGLALLGELRQATGRATVTAGLHHDESHLLFQITPDTVIGRRSNEGPTPYFAIDDPDQHISPTQLRFAHEGRTCYLNDNSLNGTYVDSGSGWEHVISKDGYCTLKASQDVSLDEDKPPEATPLSDGTKIAPVHPDYGHSFEFWEDGAN